MEELNKGYEFTKAQIAELESLRARLAEIEGQEPVAWNKNWPVMGHGRVAIGGGRNADGTSYLLYMDMGESRQIGADTTDLFPVGTSADSEKTLACIYFKDGNAMQQTIEVLQEMQVEIGFAAPVITPDVEKLKAERDALKAELESAQKDAERLDFIEETVLAAKMRGVSFDYIKHAEDGFIIEKGFRFMRYHFIGEPEKSVRAAIDAAIEQKGGV